MMPSVAPPVGASVGKSWPITESYLLYHVLRDNGVKTKFIAYPVSGHSPSDPIHQRDVNRRWAAWIQEHFESQQ